MVDYTILWHVSALQVVFALLLSIASCVIHEALHIAAHREFGNRVHVNVLPREPGESAIWALLFGTMVRVEPPANIPWREAAIAALAPLVMVPFPIAGVAIAVSRPVVDAGTFFTLLLWFAIAFPSPRDWQTALFYRPETTREVIQHG